jgi:hypothetical protein
VYNLQHDQVCCSSVDGCRLTPYLSRLSTSQLKLLAIYYNRTLAGSKQQRASGSDFEQQQYGH